jgi:hypothetical protein
MKDERMSMKTVFFAVILLMASSTAIAQQTDTFDWEGTATILGMYPDSSVEVTLVTDPVHGGSQSLQIERLSDGTPQAYVAWIKGLSDNDEVTVSFWRYDVTPSAPPSCRIWAHWNDDPENVMGHDGSASGNDDYGPGTGWDETSYTWTVVEGHTGIVIEARVYSNPGDIVWVDDMTVTAPTGATIVFPGELALNNTTWGDIKTLF